MNTIEMGSQNVNAMAGGENKSCIISGENGGNKEIYSKSAENSKPIGADLKAFAAKIKVEAKEAAHEIKEKTTKLGGALTKSENEKMNCVLGATIAFVGASTNSFGFIFLGSLLAMAGAGAMMVSPMIGDEIAAGSGLLL